MTLGSCGPPNPATRLTVLASTVNCTFVQLDFARFGSARRVPQSALLAYPAGTRGARGPDGTRIAVRRLATRDRLRDGRGAATATIDRTLLIGQASPSHLNRACLMQRSWIARTNAFSPLRVVALLFALVTPLAAQQASADGLCGLPEETPVVVTNHYTGSSHDAVRDMFRRQGAWVPYWGRFYEIRHTESEVKQLVAEDLGISSAEIPRTPFCTIGDIVDAVNKIEYDKYVYALRDCTKCITAGRLARSWADIIELGTMQVHGDPGNWTARSISEAQDADGAHVASTVGDGNDYLAVATSPPPGLRFQSDEQGHFGIGWHTESHHDAGIQAVEACGLQGGTNCLFNAGGTSLRGGCVGLAMAAWRDRDMDAERTYVVTSSSFREFIPGNLRSGCEREILGGKHEDAVAERSCEVLRIVCAGNDSR